MEKKLNSNSHIYIYAIIIAIGSIGIFSEDQNIWSLLGGIICSVIIIKIHFYLKKRFYIIFNNDNLKFTRKKIDLIKLEEITVKKNEILVIELRRKYGFWDSPWFKQEQFSKQRHIIIHLKDGQQYKLRIPFDWTSEFESELDDERLKMIIYTNTNGELQKKQNING